MELLLQSLLHPLVLLHHLHHAIRLPAHPRARDRMEVGRSNVFGMLGPLPIRHAPL